MGVGEERVLQDEVAAGHTRQPCQKPVVDHSRAVAPGRGGRGGGRCRTRRRRGQAHGRGGVQAGAEKYQGDAGLMWQAAQERVSGLEG